MSLLATKDISKVSVSDFEIERGGMTYTVDTLNEIKKINPDISLYFIIGADSLFSFKKWKRYTDILQLCTLICAVRECSYGKIVNFGNNLIKECRQGSIVYLKMKSYDVSSSDIRSSIEDEISVKEFIPQAVTQYILAHNFYKGRWCLNEQRKNDKSSSG